MSNGPIDFSALAALRPAMRRMFWRAPAPHQEGMVVSIARIDDQSAMIEAVAETTTAA